MNRRKHAPEAGGAALLRRSSTVVVVPLRWWAATSTLLALATLSCGQPLYQSPTLEISTPLADALGAGTGYNAEELAGYRDPGSGDTFVYVCGQAAGTQSFELAVTKLRIPAAGGAPIPVWKQALSGARALDQRDSVRACAVGHSHDLYLLATVTGGGLPTTTTPTCHEQQQIYLGESDVYFAKLAADTGAVMYATFVASYRADAADSIVVQPRLPEFAGDIVFFTGTSFADSQTTSYLCHSTDTTGFMQSHQNPFFARVMFPDADPASPAVFDVTYPSIPSIPYWSSTPEGRLFFRSPTTMLMPVGGNILQFELPYLPTALPAPGSLAPGDPLVQVHLHGEIFGVDDSYASIHSIATDSQGNHILVGTIGPSGGNPGHFPLVNALTPSRPQYSSTLYVADGFMTKLGPDLRTILFSTYVGGSMPDRLQYVHIGDGDMIMVAGITQSTDYPTTSDAVFSSSSGGYQLVFTIFPPNGGTLAYGARLAYSTYFGRINYRGALSAGGFYAYNTANKVSHVMLGGMGFRTLPLVNATEAPGATTYQAWLASWRVVPVGLPPTAFPQTVYTSSGQDVIITLRGSDPEGADLTYFIIAVFPEHGTLALIPPTTTGAPRNTFRYTPSPEFTGVDEFLFQVSDGHLVSHQRSDPALVRIIVERFNPRPTLVTANHFASVAGVSDTNRVVVGAFDDEYAQTGALTFSVFQFDPESQTLTPAAPVGASHIALYADSTYTFASAIAPTTNVVIGHDNRSPGVRVGFLIAPTPAGQYFVDANSDMANDLVEEIASSAATTVTPQAVNDNGRVVGTYVRGGSCAGGASSCYTAFFWNRGDADTTSLETALGTIAPLGYHGYGGRSDAKSINAAGFVAGMSVSKDGSDVRMVVWVPTGSVSYQPLAGEPVVPPTGASIVQISVEKITKHCEVVGYVTFSDSTSRGVVWTAPGISSHTDGCRALEAMAAAANPSIQLLAKHELDMVALLGNKLAVGETITRTFLWSANDLGQVTGLVQTTHGHTFGFLWIGLHVLGRTPSGPTAAGEAVKLRSLQASTAAVAFTMNNKGVAGGYSRQDPQTSVTSAALWDTLNWFGDADADGILNFMELYREVFTASGANPLGMDVYLQCEWTESVDATTGLPVSMQLDDAVIARVQDMFLRAPVDNLDGSRGAALHVDNGPDSVADPRTGATWGAQSLASGTQVSSELFYACTMDRVVDALTEAQKSFYWSRAKLDGYRRVWRPAISIFCDFRAGGAILGDWFYTAFRDISIVGYMSVVFAHELGHALGLPHHPDGEHSNYATNQVSVMNYNFGNGIVTASDNFHLSFGEYDATQIPDFDESAADESAGLNTSPPDLLDDIQVLKWPCRSGFQQREPAAGPKDWDCDGSIGSGTVEIRDKAGGMFDAEPYRVPRVTRTVPEWPLIMPSPANGWRVYAPGLARRRRRQDAPADVPDANTLKAFVRASVQGSLKHPQIPSALEATKLLQDGTFRTMPWVDDWPATLVVDVGASAATIGPFRIRNAGSQPATFEVAATASGWSGAAALALDVSDCLAAFPLTAGASCMGTIAVTVPGGAGRGDALAVQLVVQPAAGHGAGADMDASSTARVTTTVVLVSDPPVADAGPDQLHVEVTGAEDGFAAVTLDGSGSFSPTGAPLSYVWGGNQIANAEPAGATTNGTLASTATVVLPLGMHNITLVVSDGALHSTPDTVLINVVPYTETNCYAPCGSRCGPGGKKAEICHKGTTLCVADEAWASHCEHEGDYCGPCRSAVEAPLSSEGGLGLGSGSEGGGGVSGGRGLLVVAGVGVGMGMALLAVVVVVVVVRKRVEHVDYGMDGGTGVPEPIDQDIDETQQQSMQKVSVV